LPALNYELDQLFLNVKRTFKDVDNFLLVMLLNPGKQEKFKIQFIYYLTQVFN
jgi:hypothetical protein